MAKFFRDPRNYWRRAKAIARGLGLDKPPRRHILDLGCGVGLFLRYCKDCGHDVLGIDKPEQAIADATRLLCVPLLSHRIQANEPLPAACDGCDFVAIFGVNFKYPDGVWWSSEDYEFLTRDLLYRLPVGGDIVWRPNLNEKTVFLLSPEWWTARFPVTTDLQPPFQMRVTKNA